MLTTKQVETAKPKIKPYRLFDGLGLYIEVHPNGGKYWRFKYQYLLKEKRMALGKYPEISLLEAREKRDEARKLIANNIDPSARKIERRHAALAKSANTFELVAREWHENNKERWGERHGANILHRLEMELFPEIGKMPIADIKPIQLLNTLRLVEKRGAHELAKRSLQYSGQIFRYAVITERAERDITTDLKGALKPFKKGHYNAIETKELPEFLRAFRRNDARLYPQTRYALELMILTFVRTNELMGAKWEEFDFQTKVWCVPSERMKMKRPHVVPLSKQAVAILEKQKEISGKSDLVFPNIAHPRKPMSSCTVLRAIERMGYRGRMTDFLQCGLRSLCAHTEAGLHVRASPR